MPVDLTMRQRASFGIQAEARRGNVQTAPQARP